MGYKTRRKLAPLIFIGPFLIIFLIFMVYPIFYSVVLSFGKFRAGNVTFNGVKNYIYLLTDPLFFKSLANTLLILIIQVPIMTILAMIFGCLLNSTLIRGRGIFRMITFMPVLIDAVSYSIIFSLFFNENGGFINNLLNVFGIQSLTWFQSGPLAMTVIILAMTWRWTGYNSIIMLSGLQSISNDLYEAASIDGGGRWVKMRYITLPGIANTIIILLILNVGNVLNSGFEVQYLMGNDVIRDFSQTIDIYVLKWGISQNNYAIGTAAGIFRSAVSIVLIVMTNAIAKRTSDTRLF